MGYVPPRETLDYALFIGIGIVVFAVLGILALVMPVLIALGVL